METEKLYYSPIISDFHVGFECEIQSSYGWQKGVYPEVLRLDTLTMQTLIDKGEIAALKSATIRVKYLDKEDVESLGWFYTGKAVDLWFNKVGMSDSASGTHRFTEYKLHFGPEDHVLYINAYFGNQDEGCLFEGIIKNKSELKKLMKQLKIEEVLNGMS